MIASAFVIMHDGIREFNYLSSLSVNLKKIEDKGIN